MLPISARGPVAGIVARRISALAGLFEFPKAFHETIRAALRAGANLGFQLQGADGAIDLARSRLMGKALILGIGRFASCQP